MVININPVRHFVFVFTLEFSYRTWNIHSSLIFRSEIMMLQISMFHSLFLYFLLNELWNNRKSNKTSILKRKIILKHCRITLKKKRNLRLMKFIINKIFLFIENNSCRAVSLQPISCHWSLCIPPENTINPGFSDVFRGYTMRTVAWNLLMDLINPI